MARIENAKNLTVALNPGMFAVNGWGDALF
jgi:hypothetical protein